MGKLRHFSWFHPLVVVLSLVTISVGTGFGPHTAVRGADQNACVRLFRPGNNSILLDPFKKTQSPDTQPIEPPDSYLTRQSPDGRYVAFVYPWTQNLTDDTSLYVRDKQTGKIVRLVTDHMLNTSSVEFSVPWSVFLAWSPDSQWIASLWLSDPFTGEPSTDESPNKLYISRPDGSETRTAAWEQSQNTPLGAFQAFGLEYLSDIVWSADSAYLAFGVNIGTDKETAVAVWSAADLHLADLLAYNSSTTSMATFISQAYNRFFWAYLPEGQPVGPWSPQGHRLMVADKSKDGVVRMGAVDSPGAPPKWTLPITNWVIPGDPLNFPALLVPLWSPDGSLMAFINRDESVLVFGSDGHIAIHQKIETGVIPVNWTPDSRELIFRQGQPNSTLLSDLIALDVGKRQYNTRIKNLFGLEVNYRAGRMVYKKVIDKLINVEVADMSGKPLFTLVRGASDGDNPKLLWSPDRNVIAVVWVAPTLSADGAKQYHLTWANIDGSGVDDIANAFEPGDMSVGQYPPGSDNPAWLNNGSILAFRTHHGEKDSVEIINRQTGNVTRLAELPLYPQWFPKLSPDGKVLALNTTDGLYLAGLDGTPPRNISINNNVYRYDEHQYVWSPDSSALAYIHSINATDQGGGEAVSIVAADGTTITDFIITGEIPSREALLWTPCR